MTGLLASLIGSKAVAVCMGSLMPGELGNHNIDVFQSRWSLKVPPAVRADGDRASRTVVSKAVVSLPEGQWPWVSVRTDPAILGHKPPTPLNDCGVDEPGSRISGE